MTGVERGWTRVMQTSAASYSLLLSATLMECRPWASALFVGNRLKIAVASDDDVTLDEWLLALPEMELPLAGHFVASAEVVERRAGAATLELLVVEA